MSGNLIYLDNAATSFPKPREVLKKMLKTYVRSGVSPGRGSYDLADEAAELVYQTRRKLTRFFSASDPERVIFTANATDALNIALQGLLRPGDHVVSTRLEHNSVLRPLYHLEKQGMIEYDLVCFDDSGYICPQQIMKAVKHNTKLVVVSHASNVLGTVQPAKEIARLCSEHGIPLLLDAAQSAGHIPIDMHSWGIGALAFTGHKALLGPTGIGGLILSPGLDIRTTRFGGTGIESRSLIHTQSFPHRLEAGTLNLAGILGLSASLDYLEQKNYEHLWQREMALTQRLYDGLRSISKVVFLSPPPTKQSVPVLTCAMKDMDSGDVGDILDGDYGIAVRIGLHCAPLVHVDLGTDASGAIRFSPGPFNTDKDIDFAVAAMAEIAAHS
ncbi:MAG: aminotransferase class V-fold PLP-dependent enzyme [Firmicutes bacterium]|nr:aminotransferase class V-fold PLP-dependent enzyme [Bacillota bacterium]